MAGKPPRLFLDANILFSAAYDPNSRSAAIVTLAKQDVAVVLSSAYAVEEARRNLHLKRPDALERLEHLLKIVRLIPEAPPQLVQDAATRYGVPTDDAPILATALHAHADYLVTADRAHFGHLMDRPHALASIQVLSLSHALHKLFTIASKNL